MVDVTSLDIVTFGVDDESGVVTRAILTNTGRSIIFGTSSTKDSNSIFQAFLDSSLEVITYIAAL